MVDELRPPDDENEQKPDGQTPDDAHDPVEGDHASSIFLEMMRQAAARQTAQDDTSDPSQKRPRNVLSSASPPKPDEPPKPPTPSDHQPPPSRNPKMPQFFELPSDETIPDRVPQNLRRPSPPIVSQSPADDAPPTNQSRYSHRMPVYEAPDDVTAVDATEIADVRLEAQRVQRVKRRRERRRRQQVSFLGGFFRTIFITLISAGLAGTIFTWFTEPDFLNRDVVSGLAIAEATQIATLQPSPMPTPNWLRRIGIVSGHRGPENDPGAVCPDGLTESEINFNVASLVVRELRARGYSVDLLDEFDPRLDNYQAAALVSIHANTCQDFGEFVSGFLVAKAASRPEGGEDTRLAECIGYHYGRGTQLERRFTLTLDMTDYHSFREINSLTPAAILELGFMKDDRDLLTNQQPLLAQSITEGILCYLAPDENNQIPSNQPQAQPEEITTP